MAEDSEDTEHYNPVSLRVWLMILKIQNIIILLAYECGWWYWRYRSLSSR